MTDSHSGKPELTDMECDGISSLPGTSETSTECNDASTTSSKDVDGASLKLINETEVPLKPDACTDEVFNLEDTNEVLLLSNKSKETFEVTDDSEKVKLPNMSKGSDEASKSNDVNTEELMSNKGSDEASFKSNDVNTEELLSNIGSDEAELKTKETSCEVSKPNIEEKSKSVNATSTMQQETVNDVSPLKSDLDLDKKSSVVTEEERLTSNKDTNESVKSGDTDDSTDGDISSEKREDYIKLIVRKHVATQEKMNHQSLSRNPPPTPESSPYFIQDYLKESEASRANTSNKDTSPDELELPTRKRKRISKSSRDTSRNRRRIDMSSVPCIAEIPDGEESTSSFVSSGITDYLSTRENSPEKQTRSPTPVEVAGEDLHVQNVVEDLAMGANVEVEVQSTSSFQSSGITDYLSTPEQSEEELTRPLPPAVSPDKDISPDEMEIESRRRKRSSKSSKETSRKRTREDMPSISVNAERKDGEESTSSLKSFGITNDLSTVKKPAEESTRQQAPIGVLGEDLHVLDIQDLITGTNVEVEGCEDAQEYMIQSAERPQLNTPDKKFSPDELDNESRKRKLSSKSLEETSRKRTREDMPSVSVNAERPDGEESTLSFQSSGITNDLSTVEKPAEESTKQAPTEVLGEDLHVLNIQDLITGTKVEVEGCKDAMDVQEDLIPSVERPQANTPDKEFSPDELDNVSRKRKLSGKSLEETSRKRTCEDMPSVSVDEERPDGKELASSFQSSGITNDLSTVEKSAEESARQQTPTAVLGEDLHVLNIQDLITSTKVKVEGCEDAQDDMIQSAERPQLNTPDKKFSPDELDNESRKRKLSGKSLEERSIKRMCEDMPPVSVNEERPDGKESSSSFQSPGITNDLSTVEKSVEESIRQPTPTAVSGDLSILNIQDLPVGTNVDVEDLEEVKMDDTLKKSN